MALRSATRDVRYHPIFGMVPRPLLMATKALVAFDGVRRGFAFDLIDVHYFYPDGVAALPLGA
jgi:hypothetical protein